MKNDILKKIFEAKKLIKSKSLKRDGRNDYSNYDYFTPAFVEKIVSEVCEELEILTKFDLIRNELGIEGVLTVFDLETGQNMEFKMATEVPTITATNATQQIGGAMTYTERYLKMTVFGIIDNNLDFDSKDNRKPATQAKNEKPWLNPDDEKWNQTLKAMKERGVTLEEVLKHYRISKKNQELLTQETK